MRLRGKWPFLVALVLLVGCAAPEHPAPIIAAGIPSSDIPLEALTGQWLGRFCSRNPLNLFICGDIEATTHQQAYRIIGTCLLSGWGVKEEFRRGHIEATIDAQGNVLWGVNLGDGSYKASFKGKLEETRYTGSYTASGPFYRDFGKFWVKRLSN